jgi:hypothetical protein
MILADYFDSLGQTMRPLLTLTEKVFGSPEPNSPVCAARGQNNGVISYNLGGR